MNNREPLNRQVNYIVDGDGPPVVLIHGIASSIHNWHYQIPALVEQGYRVYALDLLGHGDSLKPTDPNQYHVDNVFAHTENWLLELGLNEPFIIVAHSLGAYISLRYTLKYPSQVHSLFLIDPFFSPMQLSLPLRLAAQQPNLGSKVLEAVPEWLVSPFIKYNPNVTAGLPQELVHQMTQDHMRAHPNILFTTSSVDDLSPSVTHIQQKSMVVWGDNDITLQPSSFPKLVESLPHAAGQAIPKGGHTPHLIASELVNRHILQFCRAA